MRSHILVVFCTTVTLAAACGDNEGPSAPTVDQVASRYNLTTINGQQLPFAFRPDSVIDFNTADTLVFGDVWYQDDFELSASGRFSQTVRRRLLVSSSAPNEPPDILELDARVVGRWEKTSQGLRLSADTVYEGSVRIPLTEPEILVLPLPGAQELVVSQNRGHGSLGGSLVQLAYTLRYVKR